MVVSLLLYLPLFWSSFMKVAFVFLVGYDQNILKCGNFDQLNHKYRLRKCSMDD